MRTPVKKALVIGCGIAGPAVALFLKRAGVEPVIYEARPAPDDETGLFLNLTPNGVHVLKALGIEDEVRALGHPSNRIVFQNSDGDAIAELDNTDEAERYGARSILIRRALLHRVLREAALRDGIRLHRGKTLVAADGGGTQARARFEDGTTAQGDFLVGCDGLHSRVRQTLFPDAAAPSYLDLMNTGGFARLPDLPAAPTMYMTYGQQAFFGYQVTPGGEVYWFSNFGVDEDHLTAFENKPSDERKRHLLSLYTEDTILISRIINATEHPLGLWPTYDLPFLETWHTRRACLIGDAAHATAPSAGQGASMALEDAIVLAKCMRDHDGIYAAFAAFEAVRKDRVEKAIQQARRNSGHKVASNPVQAWIRDRLLPVFLKLGARSIDWLYGYRVDWDEPVQALAS